MFVTIWMCTHEWSLISIRATAFTFETCHQRLQLLVLVDALDQRPELAVAADRHVDLHPLDRLGGRQASLRARPPRRRAGRSAQPFPCRSPFRECTSTRSVIDSRHERASRPARRRGRPRSETASRSSSGCCSRSRTSSGSSSGRIAVVLRRDRQLGRHARRRNAARGSLHRFMCKYIRYLSHLNAYLWLVANPYPGFVGEEGEYPVDVKLPPPTEQDRLKTLVRIFLAIPALFVSADARRRRLVPRPVPGPLRPLRRRRGRRARRRLRVPRLVRHPRARHACRRASATPAPTASATRAQMLAYVLLVTDRYPNADPTAMLVDGRAAAAASGPPRRRRARPAALAGARLLPAAARDPAPRLARALDGRGRDRRHPQLVRDALHRDAAPRVPPLPLGLRPLRAARLRVRLSRREPVPGLRRRAGPLSARRRAPGAGSARTGG